MVHLVQPVYTFGKISAGVTAAESGIAASRSREQGQAAELELNVRRAYWGMKLAREILDAIKDGIVHVLRSLLAEADLLMAVDGYPAIADLTPESLLVRG